MNYGSRAELVAPLVLERTTWGERAADIFSHMLAEASHVRSGELRLQAAVPQQDAATCSKGVRMEQHERLLIGELAELAGVTQRTIRYYTSEGLLPPPATHGKYARYNEEHLRLLRLIARLKEDYLPLSAIRGRLATMSAAEAERLLGERPDAEGGRAPRLWSQPGRPLPTPHGATGMLAERPASYGLPGAAQEPGRPAPGAADVQAAELVNPFRLANASLPLGRVEFFPPGGEGAEAADQGRPQGLASGEELWRHFAVAPGVELRVREPLSPRRRRQIEALLAALRDKLLSEEE